MEYETKPTHISFIQPGDTIIHNNAITTVCRKDITMGFCGLCLFGDSYRLGTKLVLRLNILRGLGLRHRREENNVDFFDSHLGRV
jgi:hypothetical protein